ncbi:NAD(+) diphosphatase [Microbacterium lushaniae]|nr:NAD(+) diphosphatase [Microbacterium lushaniae]KAA9158788.1 NAD(+) diphosphatase [Microbacterium lushaniae]
MTVPVTSSPRFGPVDRSPTERMTDDLIAQAQADPRTMVLVVRGDAAPLADDGGLAAVTVADVPEDAVWAFLGRRLDGAAVLAAAFPPDRDEPVAAPGGWGALRAIGGDLPADDTAVLMPAVALGRWLVDAPFCPACGTRTDLRHAGWARHCPQCGREHFPRTDPAVIVAVTRADDPDLLLLGSNALWGADRYSCFAGFAEAGESLEDAVVREVREEAGVTVGELRYRGSQGWPYPRSLMLGFTAAATAPEVARADGEEIVAVRWFTRAEIGDALAGRSALQLPGPASIASRLIREWHDDRP